MEAIYRIYDTVEKRHVDHIFVWPDGELWEVILEKENNKIIEKVKKQGRYTKERSTWLYDKNKVLIYENDISFIVYEDGDSENSIVRWDRWDRVLQCVEDEDMNNWFLSRWNAGSYNIVWHALRDEHLLSDK